MRRSDLAFLSAGCAILLAGTIPVIAQAPESILPPGFGEPDSAPPPPQGPPQGSGTSAARAPSTTAPKPSDGLTALPVASAVDSALSNESALGNAAEPPPKYDLPATARRSLDRIGPLTAETGGVGPEAFGQVRGQFLARLMRSAHAPFASRWQQILLRRVLLSGFDTPADINGADLAAERASLLLRMGEAEGARQIVQSVDSDNFTPRLYAVALQTYLATADPAGFCYLLPDAANKTDDPHWKAAEAICASFSGEQGTATSYLNRTLGQRKIPASTIA